MAKTTKKPQRGGAREGSGRPVGPDGQAQIVAVSIPSSIVAQLDALCAAQGWGRSEAVTRAVRMLIAR